MNTDIRIKTSFPGHIKTQKLIRRIGKEGAFSLICLWVYAAINRPKGDLTGLSNEEIAIAAQWDKDPDTFVNALIECGFIDEHLNEDGSITRKLHDWEEHNRYAYYAPERSEIARQKVLKRWQKTDNIQVDKQNNGNSSGNSGNHDQPIILEEENAVDAVIQTYTNSDSDEENNSTSNEITPQQKPTQKKPSPKNSKNSEAKTKTKEMPQILFDEDKKCFTGVEHYINKWKEAYPLVDVEQEIRKMEAWIISQPKYNWKKDWKRFITNWLSRTQSRKEIQEAKGVRVNILGTSKTAKNWELLKFYENEDENENENSSEEDKRDSILEELVKNFDIVEQLKKKGINYDGER